MADNVPITAGTGTTIATDDIAGVQVQRVKVTWGVDGTMTDANASTPLPTVQTGALPAGTNNIGDMDVLTINGQSPAFGSGANGASVLRVALATDSPGILTSDKYETVAASQTAQVLGTTGATGDYISGLLVIPATTSPGNVLLIDNATSITVFTGGAASVSNLVPFFIPLGMKSVSGAWKITTGANVSAIGIGNFT